MNPPEKHLHVALVGASDKPSRYAFMAMKMLEDYGHTVTLVSPRLSAVESRPVFPALQAAPADRGPIDTITLYVGPEISMKLAHDIEAAKPRRVIFNPGAENPALSRGLEAAGIEVIEACTLVLLRSGQFASSIG